MRRSRCRGPSRKALRNKIDIPRVGIVYFTAEQPPAVPTVIISLVAFVILLAGLILLRIKSGNRFEIKNTDVVLALVPVALWLFLTGKIQEFGFGEVKIVAALKVATQAPVENQVSKLLPVDAIPMFEKGRVGEIRHAVDNKAQALSFHIGRGNYSGSAIRRYLDDLTQYPYLRYVVLNNPDDTFFGLVDARQLADLVRREGAQPSATPAAPIPGEQAQFGLPAEPRVTADNIANWLNGNNLEELKTLPGFIAAKDALDSKADRQQALKQLNALDLQTIPVVNENQKFVGIVDRSKLTASILTDIAAKVEHSD